jgi:hypothetical protein
MQNYNRDWIWTGFDRSIKEIIENSQKWLKIEFYDLFQIKLMNFGCKSLVCDVYYGVHTAKYD